MTATIASYPDPTTADEAHAVLTALHREHFLGDIGAAKDLLCSVWWEPGVVLARQYVGMLDEFDSLSPGNVEDAARANEEAAKILRDALVRVRQRAYQLDAFNAAARILGEDVAWRILADLARPGASEAA